MGGTCPDPFDSTFTSGNTQTVDGTQYRVRSLSIGSITAPLGFSAGGDSDFRGGAGLSVHRVQLREVEKRPKQHLRRLGDQPLRGM
jgi:hypothetical protein